RRRRWWRRRWRRWWRPEVLRRDLVQQRDVHALVLLHLVGMLVDEILEQENQAELQQQDQRHQHRNAGALPQAPPFPVLDPGRERGEFGRQIRRGEDFVLLVHENPVAR